MVLSPGDKVFAKVRGSPPWPSRVLSAESDQSAFSVVFIPSGKTSKVRRRDLYSFFKFFPKFGQPRKTHGFTDGIRRILSELTPQEVKLIKRYDTNNLYAKYVSKSDSSPDSAFPTSDNSSFSDKRKTATDEAVEQTIETETVFQLEPIDFETSIFQENNFDNDCLFDDKGFIEEDLPFCNSVKNDFSDDVVNTEINNSVKQVCLIESDDVEFDDLQDDSIIPDESVVREEVISQEDVRESIAEGDALSAGPSGVKFKKTISKAREYYLSTHYSSESEEEDPSFYVRRQELEKEHLARFNNNQHDYYGFSGQPAIDVPDIMSEINRGRMPQIDFTQDFVSDDSYEYNIEVDLTQAFEDDVPPSTHNSPSKNPFEGVNPQKTIFQLQHLDETIKRALRLNQAPDAQTCLWALDSVKALNLMPGHLVDYPNIIETVKRLRIYEWLGETLLDSQHSDSFKIRQKAIEVDEMFERIIRNPEKAVYKQFHAELKFFNENIKNVPSNDMALAVLNS